MADPTSDAAATLRLRALVEADLPALLTLQHRYAGTQGWTAAELHHQLYDAGRDHGRRVVVAARGAAIAGVAGWVEAAPWCYGAPVLTADDEAATALVAHVVERGRAIGAVHVRMGAMPGEHIKQRALAQAGFAPALDFITVVRPLRPDDGALWAGPWRRIPWAELDVVALAEINNITFDGVANSAPMTADEIRSSLDDAVIDREATAAWADGDRYVGFVFAERDQDAQGRFATIAAIGVLAETRGRGVGAAILDDVFARVAGQVDEVRALIASTNQASLALHTRRGFVERARRTVYQLDLAGSAR